MQLNLKVKDRLFSARPGRFGRELRAKFKKALSETAIKGNEIIKNRTAEGVGINGPFKKYSEYYRNEKKSGWPRTSDRPAFSGDPSGTVNLMVTGQMLGAQMTRSFDRKSEIFIRGKEANRKAAKNSRTRPFFGFNEKEERDLQAFFFRRFP